MGVCVRSDRTAAAAAKWLMVPRGGSCYQQQGRSFLHSAGPPLSAQFLPSVSSERDEQHPRDEASVQPATKELGR